MARRVLAFLGVAFPGWKTVDVPQLPSSALPIPSPQPNTQVLKPSCGMSAVGRIQVTEPTGRAGWLQGQAPHCSAAHTIAFSRVPTACLASWGWRLWETGVLALALSTAQPGRAGVGQAWGQWCFLWPGES